MSFQSQFTKDNWHRDARTVAIRNAIRARRWGMRVTVFADPTPANNGDWVLSYNEADTNLQNDSNWLKVADIGQTWGGGGGSATLAKNQDFAFTGVEDSFTVTNGTLDQIAFVEVNGVVQRPTTDYTVIGQIVDFGSAIPGSGTVGIYYYEDVAITTDFLEEVAVDVSGSTITLDMQSLKQRLFVGDASFATVKAIAIDNDAEALVFDFQFEISNVAAVLTWPTDFVMQTSDTRWNTGAKEWTPSATGKYEGSAVWDDVNSEWKLKISDPFA